MKNTFSKGFTLVELLIVITILAALAAAVVVVLNPAELMAQARDSQRMNDLITVRDALLYLVAHGTSPILCVDGNIAGGGCHDGGICMMDPGPGNGPFSVQNCGAPSNQDRTVGGAGWVDVNLTGFAFGGSPITVLPVDPVNTAQFFYAYKANTAGAFKLAGRLESERYRPMMVDDGGTRNICITHTANTCFYEIGSNLAL